MKKFTILFIILLYSCTKDSNNSSTTITINSYDNKKYDYSYVTTNNTTNKTETGTETVTKLVNEGVINNVTIPNPNDEMFRWENGYKKIVDVKFLNVLTEKIEKYQLEIIVPKIMIKAKYNCENYLSYVPVELALMNSVDGTMIGQVKYNARNQYNAESEYSVPYRITKELEVEELYKNRDYN